MIFCIPCLALIIYFLILGIFIPRYRVYIKLGLRCFKDKMRGKKCNLSFDNQMRTRLSVWFLDKNMLRTSELIKKERNFNITLTIILILFTIITSYLFWLLIKFLFIEAPCKESICLGM